MRIGLSEEESRILTEVAALDLSTATQERIPSVNDLVLYQKPFVKALEPTFEGPFIVIEMDGKLATLRHVSNVSDRRSRVHPDLLKPYIPREDASA